MAVHVSIHDVSPAWASEVETALALCDSFGAVPALLVVPNYHGRSPLSGDRRFCDRLSARQARGHDVYLHGFFHRAAERPAPGLAERARWLLAQRVVSHGEAEMAALSPNEALRRLDEGEAALRDVGLRVDGFVPPAWWMPPWLRPLLAARGCRFTEDHLRVYDPARGLARLTVVLNWASRSRTRMLATVAFCRAARHARSLVPARVAIHPADMRSASLRREVSRLLEWARDDVVAHGSDLFFPGARSHRAQ